MRGLCGLALILFHLDSANADQRAQSLSAQAESGSNDDDGSTSNGPNTSSGQSRPGKTTPSYEDVATSDIPRGDAGPESGQEAKETMMKKATAGKKTNKIDYKGERVVQDPVTGRDVIVKDADFDGEFRILEGPECISLMLPLYQLF